MRICPVVAPILASLSADTPPVARSKVVLVSDILVPADYVVSVLVSVSVSISLAGAQVVPFHLSTWPVVAPILWSLLADTPPVVISKVVPVSDKLFPAEYVVFVSVLMSSNGVQEDPFHLRTWPVVAPILWSLLAAMPPLVMLKVLSVNVRPPVAE